MPTPPPRADEPARPEIAPRALIEISGMARVLSVSQSRAKRVDQPRDDLITVTNVTRLVR